MVRHQSRRPADAELRVLLRSFTNWRRSFVYRRLFIMLRREAEPAEINRVCGLYREEGLGVRKRRDRKWADGQWLTVESTEHHGCNPLEMPGCNH